MIYENTLTESQRTRLAELSEWQPYAFPNGSHYRQQRLPEGDFGDVSVQRIYNIGYYCRFSSDPDVVRVVAFDRISVGPGADFGKYFCTRDQALVALMWNDRQGRRLIDH